MNVLYEVTDTLLVLQTIGCLIGLCVSVLLIRLVKASWSFQSQRRPGIALSAALVVWNLGAISNAALIVAGFDYRSGAAKAACAFGYTGLAFLTWSVMGVWGLSIQGRWRKRTHSILQLPAAILGAAIVVLLWMDAVGARAPLSRTAIRVAAEANLYFFVLLGVVLALSCQPSKITRICAALTGFGTLGPLAALAQIPVYGSLPQTLRVAVSVYAEQSVNYVVVAAFILLARLRYTDTLVERALRYLTTILAASLLWYCVHSLVGPGAGLAVAGIASMAMLAVAAPALNRALRHVTERLFQQPDFEGGLYALSVSFRKAACVQEVLDAAASALRESFETTGIRVFPAESVPNELAQSLTAASEVVEYQPGSHAVQLDGLDADAFVPVFEKGRLAHLIAMSRSAEQRGFLASEVSFLSNIARCASSRLEALTAEREKREREKREALLLHQATEAELRALRAQINPHFLFNALNTIADLIVVDASKAERMTERLSDVFRYVLTHSRQATITVREEIDFVRRYLEIEEVRFRDRLRVSIQIAPEVSEMKVPALILQPIVENAIKHGLAPKIGGGLLSISAHRSGRELVLTVEDDGAGFPNCPPVPRPNGSSGGLGLTNTNQRLQTLYGGRAAILMESQGRQGCRVTIRIPEQEPCAP